jgi:hypothetical protein
MVAQEITIAGVATGFISFVYIAITVIHKLNISGQIRCFGLVFSVHRDDNNVDNDNNPSNSNILVGNTNNTNDITQEVEIEIIQNDNQV